MSIKLPKPATVIASIALFVALGGTSYAVTGGTAFSGRQINGAQLLDHSVAGTKLEAHTITADDLDLAGLPTVPSAVFAGQASVAASAKTAQTANTAASAKYASSAGALSGKLSGSQVSGAVADATNATSATTAASAQTLTGTISGSQVTGAVANATSAQTATTATNAASAQTLSGTIAGSQVSGAVANASAVDGDQLTSIDQWSGSAGDVTLATDLAGLTLAMRCSGGDVDLDASTAYSSASIGISAIAGGGSPTFTRAEGNFNTGTPVTATITAPSQVSFAYEHSGLVASGTLTVFDDGGLCAAFGTAQSSG